MSRTADLDVPDDIAHVGFSKMQAYLEGSSDISPETPRTLPLGFNAIKTDADAITIFGKNCVCGVFFFVTQFDSMSLPNWFSGA